MRNITVQKNGKFSFKEYWLWCQLVFLWLRKFQMWQLNEINRAQGYAGVLNFVHCTMLVPALTKTILLYRYPRFFIKIEKISPAGEIPYLIILIVIHTCRNKVKDAWLQLCSQLVFGPTKYCTIIATRVEAINKLEQNETGCFLIKLCS